MIIFDPFSENSIESISQLLAEKLTGSKITSLLKKSGILTNQDNPKWTKWKRIYTIFSNFQNQKKSSNYFIQFIHTFIDPINFIGNESEFDVTRTKLNNILAFEGLKINESGIIQKVTKSTTLKHAKINASKFREKLEINKIHPKIITFCNSDILNEDYFSIIFESTKALFHELKSMTQIDMDGNKLILECFDKSNPIIVFNTLKTETERNEYDGFRALLLSIGNLFRNPRAHTPKIFSYENEDDCLEILNIISFALKKLQNCQINFIAISNKR